MRERLGKERVMTSISLRIPERVIEDLKEIAPSLGFSGYQGLIKAYISKGLRADLERLEGSQVQALTESLRKLGVSDEVISAAIAEAHYPQIRLERQIFPEVQEAVQSWDPEGTVEIAQRLDGGTGLLFDVYANGKPLKIVISAKHAALGESDAIRKEVIESLDAEKSKAS
jgi:hypothetical protein